MPVDVSLKNESPHNLEAEQCVLGSVLIDNTLINSAIEIIETEDFYQEAHRRIFARMVELSEKGKAIDLVTLKESLLAAGELESIGGAGYLASIVDGIPRIRNIEHYLKIVKGKSTLRRLITATDRIRTECYSQEHDVEQILEMSEKSVFEIHEGAHHGGFVPLGPIATEQYQELGAMAGKGSAITGVPTGIFRLDELTSGFQPSDLIVLAARPRMGKTALALNIASHFALEHEGTVGLFSLEMSRRQLVMRLLSSEARIDLHRLRTGHMRETDWGKLAMAVSNVSRAKIFIDDTGFLTPLEMTAKARRLKMEHGLQLLIVDYLQLMQTREKFDSRNLQIGEISRAMKALAKDLDIPILALSQLSRAPEARRDHRPQLSDLRESGAIEQDADVVLFIYRDEEYTRNSENAGLAELIIGKQRNGPTDIIPLAFLKEFTRFENLDWESSE